MKFEQLRVNFLDMKPEEQRAFVYEYIDKRTSDLAEEAVRKSVKPTVTRAKGGAKKPSKKKQQSDLKKALALLEQIAKG